ncbi:hypothetical protein DL240_09145 [Lujinxingia litoralis]|uniref:Uncharacterized protein n=1 Tax=Lujinxingia litoralis TaxID=2211119 RepID=A0A328C617_9DELT|nr:hypothetical protein [Lujinxingia litoralis]RAL23041.1 hypothetical protein DL240_09145 [Lujinxingia litoralis]
MGLFETLNRLGVLGAGRRPEWRSQSTTYGPPAALSAGVPLSGAMKTLVYVAPREEAHYRTARIRLSFSKSALYTATINGIDVDQGAYNNEATTLSKLAEGINADVNLQPLVQATYDADAREVIVRGLGPEDFMITTTSTYGDITVHADATECTARVWLLPGGIANAAKPSAWVQASRGEFMLDHRGMVERVDTAGFDRLYIEIADADGLVHVAVGPGVLE